MRVDIRPEPANRPQADLKRPVFGILGSGKLEREDRVALRRRAAADVFAVTEPFQRPAAKDPADIGQRELPVKRPVAAGAGQREPEAAIEDELNTVVTLFDTANGLPTNQTVGILGGAIDLVLDLDQRESIDLTEVEIVQRTKHSVSCPVSTPNPTLRRMIPNAAPGRWTDTAGVDHNRAPGWSVAEDGPLAERTGGADGMSTETTEIHTLDELRTLRDRLLPMLQVVGAEYDTRTEPGYPVIFDNVEDGGYFGVNLDPGYGLYIMTDGQQIIAQLNIIAWRTDVRSSANKEKFASLPFDGVRPVSNEMSDGQLRNLISELLSHWNRQPLNIRISDS